MKKYLLILIFALIGIGAAHAQVSCPIKYSGSDLTGVNLVSNGYNNYLQCSYGSAGLDEIIPMDKQIFHAVNPNVWARNFSNLSHNCTAIRTVKRPASEQELIAASQQCAVRECPRKGPCIL